MSKPKKHVPGQVVKGPGTIRWKTEQAVKTVAAVIREKRDQKRDGKA